MIQKDRLIRVMPGQENRGVNPVQKENAKKVGLELAKRLGVDTKIPGLQRKK